MKNLYTEDHKKTVLIVSSLDIKEAIYLSKNIFVFKNLYYTVQIIIDHLIDSGHNTFIFHKNGWFENLVCTYIKSIEVHHKDLYTLGVFENNLDIEIDEKCRILYDDIVLSNEENIAFNKKDYFNSLLCSSNLLISFNPKYNKDIELLKGMAKQKRREIIEIGSDILSHIVH